MKSLIQTRWYLPLVGIAVALVALVALQGVFANSNNPGTITNATYNFSATPNASTLTVSGTTNCATNQPMGVAFFVPPNIPDNTTDVLTVDSGTPANAANNGAAPLGHAFPLVNILYSPGVASYTTNCGVSRAYTVTLSSPIGRLDTQPAQICNVEYHIKSINGNTAGYAVNITADGPSVTTTTVVNGKIVTTTRGRNTDNSVETNGFVYTTGACFNLTGLTTSATATAIVGTTISDSATLSGATATATGNITFKAYPPSDATCAGAAAFTSGNFPVNGNGTYGPASFTATQVGDYHWRAFYTGSTGNSAASTACGDTGETTTVTKGSPTITTTATGTVKIGATINDVAHVVQPANTINTTGAITFDVYAPGDTTCATSLATLSATPATNGTGDYTSANFTTTAAGVYRWIAHLASDTHNNGANTACNDGGESSTVINPVIDVSKTPASQSVPLNGTANFTIVVTNIGDVRLTGIVVTDAQAPNCGRTAAQTAALSTAQNGHAYLDPNESFTYTCTFSPVTVPFVNVVFACGNDVLNDTVCDTDNNGGNPPPGCDPTAEANRCAGVTPSGLTTTQDFLPRDKATLTGLVGAAGGTVTYKLYKGSCDAGNLLDTLTAPVNGNGDYTVTSASFLSALIVANIVGGGTATSGTAGTYNWLVSYSGDAGTNNAAIPGTCGTEHFTVTNS